MTPQIETSQEASPAKRSRQILGNLALTLASVVFAFGMVEVMLRIVPLDIVGSAGGDRGYFSRFDAKLGWAPIPSVRQYHADQGFSVLVEQNSLGLRAPPEIGKARTNGKYRALVLGDSYVWGYGADQTDIFTQGKVHARDDLELVNMGVSGYGTDQALLLYRNFGRNFDVDAVVLAFTTYNDIANNISEEAYGYDKPFFTLDDQLTLHDGHIADATLRRWWTGFLKESRAASVINTGIVNLKYLLSGPGDAKRALSKAVDRVRTAGELDEEDKKGLDLTAAVIAALRDEVEGKGAQFKVVFIPYKPHILAKLDNDHPLVTPLSERLDALGVKHSSPYAAFLQEARKGAQLFNGMDNHFNAAGHKVFGAFLAEALPRP